MKSTLKLFSGKYKTQHENNFVESSVGSLNNNYSWLKKVIFLLTVLVAFPVFQACEDQEQESPPKLPPIESMVMNKTIFEGTNTTSNITLKDILDISVIKNSEASNKNFTNASNTFWLCQSVLTVFLVIPVASFAVAMDQQPEYLGDSKWQWSYNFQSTLGTFAAKLTGEIKTDKVVWEMYISKEGVDAFDNVKWYEGTSALDASGGDWTINWNAQNPAAVLQIDWKKTNNKVGDIKYTYINDKVGGVDDPTYGSYITYGLVDAVYNAFYNVYWYSADYGAFLSTDIEVNTKYGYGRIKSEYLYSDLNWRCWNEDGLDGDCE